MRAKRSRDYLSVDQRERERGKEKRAVGATLLGDEGVNETGDRRVGRYIMHYTTRPCA
jgi:hypothetical protein